jgi:hypothetical protein
MTFTPATAKCGFSQSGFRNSEVTKKPFCHLLTKLLRGGHPASTVSTSSFKKNHSIMHARPRFSTASTPLGAFQAIVTKPWKIVSERKTWKRTLRLRTRCFLFLVFTFRCLMFRLLSPHYYNKYDNFIVDV